MRSAVMTSFLGYCWSTDQRYPFCSQLTSNDTPTGSDHSLKGDEIQRVGLYFQHKTWSSEWYSHNWSCVKNDEAIAFQTRDTLGDIGVLWDYPELVSHIQQFFSLVNAHYGGNTIQKGTENTQIRGLPKSRERLVSNCHGLGRLKAKPHSVQDSSSFFHDLKGCISLRFGPAEGQTTYDSITRSNNGTSPGVSNGALESSDNQRTIPDNSFTLDEPKFPWSLHETDDQNDSDVLSSQVKEIREAPRKVCDSLKTALSTTQCSSPASTLQTIGSWVEAEILAPGVAEHSTQTFEENHSRTFAPDNETLIRQIFRKYPSFPELDDPSTLKSLDNLSIHLLSQCRFPEAQTLLSHTLQLRTRLLGESHPQTLTTMSNLASSHWGVGDFQAALALFQNLSRIRSSTLGPSHPLTLSSLSNLGATYKSLKSYPQAHELAEQVTERTAGAFGELHPKALDAEANLAIILKKLGREEEAEVLELKVLEGRKQVLGEEHRDTLSSFANLGAGYNSRKFWEKAEVYNRIAVVGRGKVLGEGHEDTLRSVMHLSISCSGLGRLEEAEELMGRAAEGLGEGHALSVAAGRRLQGLRREG